MDIKGLIAAISERFGRPISEGWVRQQIRAGRLAKPRKPSHKVADWPATDVDDFFARLDTDRRRTEPTTHDQHRAA